MNYTHVHLLLNHFPIIGTLLGGIIMVFGLFSKSKTTQKSALGLWVLMALAAIPVMLTGESAEEAVEHLPGVSEGLIGQHEEMAELAFWAMEALGGISLLVLIFSYFNKRLTGAATIATTVLAVIVFGLMARTGYLGGQIRHTEIRQAAAYAPGQELNDQDQDDD